MHCLAALERLTSGQVFIEDVEVGRLTDKALAVLRRERIGFVFQSYNLVPTLALSIYERTHELGLLRAVGMTRPLLRRTVRGEAVIIALLGTVEGLVVGILLGWAVVAALESQGVTQLSIPVRQLVVVTMLAALAGVVAAAAPGRRAARLNVLRAISTH